MFEGKRIGGIEQKIRTHSTKKKPVRHQWAMNAAIFFFCLNGYVNDKSWLIWVFLRCHSHTNCKREEFHAFSLFTKLFVIFASLDARRWMILGHFRPLFGHYKRAIVVLAAFYTITEQVILRLLRHDFRYTSSKPNWKVPKRNRDRSH